MNTMNFDPHSYEIQRQRQQQLIALAEQERLVRAAQPAKNYNCLLSSGDGASSRPGYNGPARLTKLHATEGAKPP